METFKMDYRFPKGTSQENMERIFNQQLSKDLAKYLIGKLPTEGQYLCVRYPKITYEDQGEWVIMSYVSEVDITNTKSVVLTCKLPTLEEKILKKAPFFKRIKNTIKYVFGRNK